MGSRATVLDRAGLGGGRHGERRGPVPLAARRAGDERPTGWPTARRGRYGDEAWVVTLDQMEEEGWFGGPLAAEVRARLGDVAIVPYEPVAYLDPADGGDVRLVCRHGSLTPDEMLVPLLAGHGRLGA